MRTALLALAAALSLPTLLGCTSPPAGGPDAPIEAIAVLAKDAPPPEEMGVSVAADALILLVGNGASTCDTPYLPPWHVGNECDGPDRSEWQIFVVIPSESQQPGSLSLDDPASVNGLASSWVDGSQCAGASGSGGVGGMMDIVSLDSSSVVVSFHDMPEENNMGPGDHHLMLNDGESVTAERCP